MIRIAKYALAAIAAFAAIPAAADTLVENVDGVTIGEDGKVQRFTGLVFDDEGRITQVLERGDERPRTDFLLDGKGKVMLPGMIDAHVHVMDIGFAALTLDLSDTNSLEEALARLMSSPKTILAVRGFWDAAGIRGNGGLDASPLLLNWMRLCPTVRSGSNEQTITPIGRTAWQWSVQGSPLRPKIPLAEKSFAMRAARQPACSSTMLVRWSVR